MLQINLFVTPRLPVDRKQLRQKAEEVLRENQIDHAQLDISVVGKRKMKQIHLKQIGKEKVTDVLSFPQHEKGELDDFQLPPETAPHLGDVVICFPVALNEARKYGKLVNEQLCLYLEHGLMHLLGYHHE